MIPAGLKAFGDGEMTADQFRDALRTLKVRQNWLAERLGIETSTVNRWATGKLPVPQYAVFCLSLLEERDSH